MREQKLYHINIVYYFITLAYKLVTIIIKHLVFTIRMVALFIKRNIFIVLVLTISQISFTQTYKRDTLKLSLLKTYNKEEDSYMINPGMDVTSLTCKIEEGKTFEGMYIIAAGDTIIPQSDIERGVENGLLSSELIVFRNKISTFQLHAGPDLDKIIFFYINASIQEKTTPEKEVKKKVSENCSEPESVDQSVWREGLATKEYTRTVHPVYNIIIHHSAGNILSDNYTQVVRDIYVYHTFDRDWSDIGYNYLIANDGTIFKGRDPGEYEQDNVMGAHFCGYNSNTMGICVMGTYTDVIPSDSAIASLVSLLTWKIVKDDLNPLLTHWHPLNYSLPIIAGHRDGCATECPGQKLYEMFPELRQRVNDSALLCPGWDPDLVNKHEDMVDVVLIYPNPAKDFIYIKIVEPYKCIEVTDILGKKSNGTTMDYSTDIVSINIKNLNPGLHYLFIHSETGLIRKKFIVN
ncbi:MAG: N-acetylmuramoyl-L-alanine amidase [Bacteroidales bacterium]|nr:N-acetylmuramoyl-L-alanine amidase [Bacteroidales bacterium]